MTTELILVTGASGGQQGKTGRHVSEMLLARGVPVRALVHRIDERSDHLRALGAEVFEGDFLDIRSVQRAVQGASSIYFAYPVQDGLLDATATMAVAAPMRVFRAPGEPGDAGVVAGRPHAADAAELPVGTGLRLGGSRSRASQGHGIL